MTKHIFPLMILALIVTLAGPLAANWIGGLTLDAADSIATTLEGVSQ